MLNALRFRSAARAIFAVSRASRRRKLKQFFSACQPRPTDRVLDIGVAGGDWSEFSGDTPIENFLESNYPWPERLVGLSMDPLGAFRRAYPQVQAVRADGCRLPFSDGAFDLVFTNAVVEHVGDRERQAHFVRECLRVSRGPVFLTAPNRLFPFDIHLGLPIVHWLPRRIYSRFTDDDHLHLLDPWTLKKLVPKGVGVSILSPIWSPSTVMLLRGQKRLRETAEPSRS